MTDDIVKRDTTLKKHLDAVMETFPLSRQEGRLVLELVSGVSLKEAAHNIGIRYETARGYLKSIFAKTGCNSQVTLILKIHHDLKLDSPHE